MLFGRTPKEEVSKYYLTSRPHIASLPTLLLTWPGLQATGRFFQSLIILEENPCNAHGVGGRRVYRVGVPSFHRESTESWRDAGVQAGAIPEARLLVVKRKNQNKPQDQGASSH